MTKIFSLPKGRALCYTLSLIFGIIVRLISPISPISQMTLSETLV